jgi:hypothetical protein
MSHGLVRFSEVNLFHFNDETNEKVYVVDFYDVDYKIVKSEYYRSREAAYMAASEIKEKKS